MSPDRHSHTPAISFYSGGIEAAQFTGENFMHILVLMLKEEEEAPEELKMVRQLLL